MTGPTDDECGVTAADGDDVDPADETPDAADQPSSEIPAESGGDYEPL